MLENATTAPSALRTGLNEPPFPVVPGAPGTWLTRVTVPVARS